MAQLTVCLATAGSGTDTCKSDGREDNAMGLTESCIRLLGLAVTFAVVGSATTQTAVAQDAANGQIVFRKCRACHMIGPGAKNRIGPALTGVVGRKIASVDGFNYSDAMKSAASDGLTWNEEKLDQYLKDPRKMVPGTRMAFPGLGEVGDRRDLIAYLKQAAK